MSSHHHRHHNSHGNSKEDDMSEVEVEFGDNGGFRAFETSTAVPPKTVQFDVGADLPGGGDGFGIAGGYHPPYSGRSASGTGTTSGPVDLDALYNGDDTDSLLSDEDGDHRLLVDDGDSEWQDDYDFDETLNKQPKFFNNPNKRLLDNDASLIPGSPFSKPPNKPSNRPSEPLAIAKYASVTSALITLGWVCYLIYGATNYTSVGRIIIEIILAFLSFFGLFWNSYFIVASIFKCFIPAKAFKTNTKYCSIIPETAPPGAKWLDVTIQIPVYKESLKEVLMPTLQSCMKSRDHYLRNTGRGTPPSAGSASVGSGQPVRCNIVVCDDGMMAFLRDNFAAAEMLWENVVQSQGRTIKLRQLLKGVPRASRRHLKGLRSKDVYEVFHRMIFYYHFDIGFVARSTVDRRGKFKKASNLNSHLRLSLGAMQMAADQDVTLEEALVSESHNEDGSRYVMFGNDVRIGDLICVNDADARMAESVILKTVPEFLNDRTLGFTQHATKTMNDQRGETYFTNMLTVYTDALYQGHFLLSSILGCHPPLVGHSIFLRTAAVKQCGRMRTLRKAQRWLRNIGLQFLPVDQVGFSNLQAENRIEYWSENHVSEDFELMIHLYNLGFNGRYCAYPDCEFQEGITRTFDEEAGRHRKFALGAHELVFNSFQDMCGHGIFTGLFKTFLTCDIPSYYKIFLTAYLCSYTSGGAYLIVFVSAAVARILDNDDINFLYVFSPAGVIILNFVIYYVLGYITFIISILRMHFINNKLLFPEYRKKIGGSCYLIFVMVRYCLTFQFLFYSVATFTFYFLGSMDHLMARPGIVSATNKDSITISRCTAFWEMVKFNSSSFALAFLIGALGYLTILQDQGWDYRSMPDDFVKHALFAGPALFLMVMCFVVPVILNPYILGWPFLCRKKPAKKAAPKKVKLVNKDSLGREVVDVNTFMKTAEELQEEIERVEGKPDVELGSLGTRDLRSHGSPSFRNSKKALDAKQMQQVRPSSSHDQQRMPRIPEAKAERPSSHSSRPAAPAAAQAQNSRRQSAPDNMPGRPKRYNDHFPYTNYPTSGKSAI